MELKPVNPNTPIEPGKKYLAVIELQGKLNLLGAIIAPPIGIVAETQAMVEFYKKIPDIKNRIREQFMAKGFYPTNIEIIVQQPRLSGTYLILPLKVKVWFYKPRDVPTRLAPVVIVLAIVAGIIITAISAYLISVQMTKQAYYIAYTTAVQHGEEPPPTPEQVGSDLGGLGGIVGMLPTILVLLIIAMVIGVIRK